MWNKVVLDMKSEKVLINSAMLTAIWEETQKDNIELLKPFVIFLINETSKKGEEINCSKICELMGNKFSFIDFPQAVLIKVLNRLKNIVKRDYKKYYLIKNISKESDEFLQKEHIVKNESELVINALRNYLKENVESCKNISYKDTQDVLLSFLEKNGFITIKNTGQLEEIGNIKKDNTNYYIAKFITCEYEKNSQLFHCIYKMASGFMLANAIYMQVENDNKESLKKLDCYLDTPLILNVLGYKTEEQNNVAKKLIELLKEKKANIKCFRHNFEEVETIISSYKENLGKLRVKTLEGLDALKYTKKDVETIILSNLEVIFRRKGIDIVDTPDFSNHSYVIGEEELKEFLEQQYSDKEEKVTRVIQTDVDSISAIARLRKGQKYKKIEDCKAIFITTNYFLVQATNSFFNKKEYEEIGYLINDIELTTILWLKSFKENPELPKLKLIENARIALDPPINLMNKFIENTYKFKEQGLLNDTDIIENIQTNTYFKSELMEKSEGKEENVTQELVRSIIFGETDKLKEEKLELETQLNIEREKNKLVEKQKQDKDNIITKLTENIIQSSKKYAKQRAKKIGIIIKIIIYMILIGIGGLLIYSVVTDLNINSKDLFNIWVKILAFIIIDIGGIIGMLFPKINVINKFIDRKMNLYEDNVYCRRLEEKKKENPQLFKSNEDQ